MNASKIIVCASQLNALQTSVLKQINYALGDYAQQQKHLSSDSRKIQAGDAFFAYSFDPNHPENEHADGRNYVQSAIQNGAGAVLWQEGRALPQVSAPTRIVSQLNLMRTLGARAAQQEYVPNTHIPMRAVPQLNILAGHIAHAYYGQPSEHMRTIAITGTNGKTSCAQWLAQILERQQLPCGIMGTLGVGFPGNMQETGFTTPQAIEVQRYLAQLHAQGAQAVAMEVSSHALEQGRVNGVEYEVALFTNLSRDHLDYHGDMASYAAAKEPLFAWHSLKHAVINTDDATGQHYARVAKKKLHSRHWLWAQRAAGVCGYLLASQRY